MVVVVVGNGTNPPTVEEEQEVDLIIVQVLVRLCLCDFYGMLSVNHFTFGLNTVVYYPFRIILHSIILHKLHSPTYPVNG